MNNMPSSENASAPISESENIDYIIDEVERVAKEVKRTGFLGDDEIIPLQNRLSLIIHSERMQIIFTREQVRRISTALNIFPNFFSFEKKDTENAIFFHTVIKGLMAARDKMARMF